MKKRHKVYWTILRPFATIFVKIKLGYKHKVAKELPEQYLVLSNHATDYDPILVGASFPRQMYYIASEHIARWKVAYFFLKHLFAPIIRYKGAPATVAIMEAMRIMKKGGNVCMFAEGVRTWDGCTCDIAPATAKLVKSMKCGLVTYKITGGYFTSPMWSGASVRKGKIYGAPVNVYTKEQLAELSVDEIYQLMVNDLSEDAYERQLADPIAYKGKNLAKGLENLMFICPSCGKKDTFVSEGNQIRCKECEATYTYDEYGMLQDAPYKTLKEVMAWQKEEIRKDIENGVAYNADGGTVKAVKNHEETLLSEGKIRISKEELACGDFKVAMKDITDLAMHGQKAIVFSVNKDYYEMIPAEGFNSLKFFLYYEELKNSK